MDRKFPQALETYPDRLELELTEAPSLTDAKTNIAKLRALKALGLQLAVDDFGTGYSSLSYLKRFPHRYAEIDQSFVADLHSPDGAAIVDAIIAWPRPEPAGDCRGYRG